MDVRLVAYKRSSIAIADPYNLTQYELDLKDSPNVILNFNWLDIKNPDQRKGSYSQTVKLPFTDRNNKFFENWFDVNLDTLVFNSKYKFNMVVYVDSVPQMKGYIQLKQIYLNAQLYEIVLFGNIGNFFSDIKGKKLKKAFENKLEVGADGEVTYVIDDQLDHYLSCKNIVDSWTTGVTTINSVADKDVMYPIIDYGHTTLPYSDSMFTPPSYLDNIVGFSSWTDILNEYGILQPGNMKPAIRLRRLIYIIAQKAGYTITSSFLGINQNGTFIGEACTQGDGSAGCYDSNGDCVSCGGVTYPYFARLFMTLADEHPKTYTEYTGLNFSVSYNSTVTQNFYGNYQDITTYWVYNTFSFFCNTINYDEASLYSYVLEDVYVPQVPATVSFYQNYITIPAPAQAELMGITNGNVLNIQSDFEFQFNGTTSDGQAVNQVELTIKWYIDYPGVYTNTVIDQTEQIVGANEWHNLSFNAPDVSGISGCTLSWKISVMCPEISPGVTGNENVDVYLSCLLKNFTIQSINGGQTFFGNGVENGTVVMAQNMPDITQADFIKDLINRFNLVIVNDNDNEYNLIIEPYQDYISGGSTKYWTDKLDLSKEQLLKPTNELQNKFLIFQDQQNDDYLNKGYFEKYDKVYGANIRENLNDFVSGDFNNFSVFTPFISQMLPTRNGDGDIVTTNYNPYVIASKYGINDNGERYVLDQQKPSLFYYGGTPKTVDGYTNTELVPGDVNVALDFKILSSAFGFQDEVWTSYATDQTGATDGKFPICSQYDLDDVTDSAGITSTTKQLLWGWVSPRFIAPSWSANAFGDNTTQRGYFKEYWASFINEVYSDEARIMECYLYLTPDDIREFEANAFKNTYYIKNTLWRILSIDGYLTGGNKSTKVTLLKVVEKLSYDCAAEPSTFNLNGTITFVDPSNPSGGAVTITNTCCEELNPDWTFVQTNEATGVGTCYWNLTISITNPSGTTTPEDVFGEVEDVPFMSMLPMPSNTIANRINLPASERGLYATIFLSALSEDNTAVELRNMTPTSQMKPPNNTMAYMKMDLIGTIAGADNDTNVGDSGHFQYDTIIKNIDGVIDYVGASGGIVLKANRDTNFPAPTINITGVNADTNLLKLTITSSSADYKIKWVAKLELIMQRIDKFSYISDFAIFQNDDRILLQNANFLEWN
tara:strand:+ start:3931 stop:7437 length:3507 start_codon:yes stop_codon:yes gene_type:complete